MFGFAEGYDASSDELYGSEGFLKHAAAVVQMLDATVNMLGPDLEPVTEALFELGSRHVSYGVMPEHYSIVGQALLSTLEAALCDAWTPKVKEGWVGIYAFISTTMIRGASFRLEGEEENRGSTLLLPGFEPVGL